MEWVGVAVTGNWLTIEHFGSGRAWGFEVADESSVKISSTCLVSCSIQCEKRRAYLELSLGFNRGHSSDSCSCHKVGLAGLSATD